MKPLAVLLTTALLCASSAHAVPNRLSAAGALRNLGGSVVDGAYTLKFALYASEEGGAPLWTEPQAISVTAGAFTALLGDDVPLPAGLFGGEAGLWLGVRVENEPELPREPLATVAYAFVAARAASADVAGALACTGCVSAAALDFDVVTPAELAGALLALPPLYSIDGLKGGALLSELDMTKHEVKNLRMENAPAPPFACDAAGAGGVYFDTAKGLFFGCNGKKWLPLANAPTGSSAENPGLSCKDILASGGSDGDGTYWIDPDGVPHDDAFQVHCDMTTDGGGWTLVAYNQGKSRTFLTGSYHAVAGSLIPAPASEAALDPGVVGLQYTQIGFYIDDPQWTAPTRSYHGFWVGKDPKSMYDLKSNQCQLLSPTVPTQWPGKLVYFGGNGANDDGCTGGGSSFGAGGHTCDDGGGGVTTDNAWPMNGSDSLWGYNCISSYSPTGAYKQSGIPNQGLHAYYVR